MSAWRILGDWGSTRLRLWRLRDGEIIDRRNGPGILTLSTSPAGALRAALAPWLADGAPESITLCGMAGARNGFCEAPYAECPVDVSSWRRLSARCDLDGAPVCIGAGCASAVVDGERDDVMRGEETQIFGALSLRPDRAVGREVFILPGTHSKWVTIEDGRIAAFRTFFTGELFALLQSSSLGPAKTADETDADREGFADGMARPARAAGLLGALFEARASQLRRGKSAQWARGFISGLLIAEEAAEIRAQGQLPDKVMIIGESALAAKYAQALGAFGVSSESLDGEGCALAGLRLLDADD